MVRQIILPSEPEAVSSAVRFVEAAAGATGLPGEVVDRAVLATGEAVANAIEHGNSLDPSRVVRLRWEEAERGGWLSIEDERGSLSAADLAQARLPSDPMQTCGRGLYLIRELSDRADVDGGILRLKFEPRPPVGGGAASA